MNKSTPLFKGAFDFFYFCIQLAPFLYMLTIFFKLHSHRCFDNLISWHILYACLLFQGTIIRHSASICSQFLYLASCYCLMTPCSLHQWWLALALTPYPDNSLIFHKLQYNSESHWYSSFIAVTMIKYQPKATQRKNLF